MDNEEAFFNGLKEAVKQQRREQKSDDIIMFISSNWRIFSRQGKAGMNNAMEMLGRDVPYKVDSLCDLLGIPDNVYFKRSPVADIGGALLNFPGSSLLKLFEACVAQSANREACLFVVAGQKSICITNMQTRFEEAVYDFFYRHPDYEIHVFKAADAVHRLKNLFNK